MTLLFLAGTSHMAKLPESPPSRHQRTIRDSDHDVVQRPLMKFAWSDRQGCHQTIFIKSW